MIKLKEKAKAFKKDIQALFYAFRKKNLGVLPSIFIALTLGYALSPIDLIPDFIPILGYLDDLIILPLLIWLSIRFIPEYILKEARAEAERNPVQLKKNIPAAVIIILIWLAIAAWFIFKWLPRNP
jgi:uncharacterized membrane protein YkvA (DUF1232 family)